MMNGIFTLQVLILSAFWRPILSLFILRRMFIRILAMIRLTLLLFMFMMYGCSGTNTGKLDSNTLNKEIIEPCFSGSSDWIDLRTGCPMFLLHRELQDYENHVLVVKADRSLFEKDDCYNLSVGGSKYNSLLFDISIDVYSSGGLQEIYCGDIDIVNEESPKRVMCTSGKVKCLIQSIGDVREIVTLELTDAQFVHNGKKIKVSEILFENVLISEWGG